jgi:hypothetical protein
MDNQKHNNPDLNNTTDPSSSRPSKVQKTIPQTHNCSLNIPVFMGHTPIITPQSYSPVNLQNTEENDQDPPPIQQESPRIHNYSSRRQQGSQSGNNSHSSTKEGPFCMYNEEHISDGVHQCKHSLIGKLLSEKPLLKSILQNTLMGIWGNPKGFTITEIEGGLYHITMDSDSDLQRVVKGNPWILRNNWLMVHPWDRKISPNNMDFKHVPMWIQLWGLPIHCKTTTMGRHLGAQLGKVEDVGLYDYPQKARIVKIKVKLNVEEPIRAGLFIGNPKDGINWVDFRYENLPMFCFGCGLIGHNEDKCSDPYVPQSEGEVNPRGPWLRSNIYGRRINEHRDKRFNSNPMQSASGGQFSPIPKAMLDMLAKMKLEEEEEESDSTPQNHTSGKDTTRDTTMNTYNQTPTIPKRKFQKTQRSSQIMYESTSSMVSLEEKANQGQ